MDFIKINGKTVNIGPKGQYNFLSNRFQLIMDIEANETQKYWTEEELKKEIETIVNKFKKYFWIYREVETEKLWTHIITKYYEYWDYLLDDSLK